MLRNRFPLDLQRVSKKYSDAFLTTKDASDDQVLAVHRVLMASLSPKLGELFEGGKKKGGTVVVRNIRFEVLSAIVGFVYSGQIVVENKGAEFIEDLVDGLNMLKIDVGEKAQKKIKLELKIAKEAKKVKGSKTSEAKEAEDARELRELEAKLAILKRKNDLAEMGRKRSARCDMNDENLNKKRRSSDDSPSRRELQSKDGATSHDYSKESPRDHGRKSVKKKEEEIKLKHERQRSSEHSEESCDIRGSSHKKQKRDLAEKKRASSWHKDGDRGSSRRSHDEREPARKSRSDESGLDRESRKRGRDNKREGSNVGRRWISWNFAPMINPGPDPNWPSQAQVKIGPLPGNVTRDQLDDALRKEGDLRRLYLQQGNIKLTAKEIRYAYVVFREPEVAQRLLKASCINVAEDYFKVGSMKEAS